MRKLVVQQWVTVDNIAAEEDCGLSFVSASPFPRPPSEFKGNVMGIVDSVDTMVLNNLTKFVASSKLAGAPWGDFPPRP